ncbi:MAG TPA: hypothetical protein VHB01_06830 [Nitrosospira sp.]|nr:hypothetical protein [Nitrosospira sp.]
MIITMRQPKLAFCFAARVLSVLVIIFALLTGHAHAASEQRTVESGKSFTVPSENDLVDQSGSLKGKVAISKSDPKGLTYTAPEVDNTFTETVKFTDGSTPKTIDVTIVPSQVYSAAFKTLFVLFVVAILLESALAIIFNWRVFLALFDGRGMRTVISVVLALVVTWNFDLDVLSDLIKVYGGGSSKGDPTLGKIITALILAGGSSGVNNILITLGYRSRKTEEDVAPRPKDTDSWIAVRLKRERVMKGPVLVHIGPSGANPMPVVGVITGEKDARKPGIMDYFFRDKGRFPNSGGYTIAPGLYEVWVSGHNDAGALMTKRSEPIAIGVRAIVDIELKL